MSEPQPSARDLWNLRTYQLEGVVDDPNMDPPVREAVQQLLRYRTRYGDIDAPPKSPQPVAGGCEWLGECEPPWSTDPAKHQATMAALQRAQDDIAALRAEVERRDEIIACEVGLRQRAEGERDEALCTAVRRSDTNRELADRALRAEACTDALFVERDTAKAEAARYRAAIVECISDGRGEADMLRAIAWALLTQQERGA